MLSELVSGAWGYTAARLGSYALMFPISVTIPFSTWTPTSVRGHRPQARTRGVGWLLFERHADDLTHRTVALFFKSGH